jgi:hypothetical protein
MVSRPKESAALKRRLSRCLVLTLFSVHGSVAGCGSSTTSTPAPDAAGSDLVVECQALATNFEQKCSGDTSQDAVCLWRGYAKLCATGRAQLLIDSMKCLDATTCRTFAYAPDKEQVCLTGIHVRDETQAARSFIQNDCLMCGSSSPSCTTTGLAEIYPYLTDADLSALSACRGSGCPGATPAACESIQAVAGFTCLFGH